MNYIYLLINLVLLIIALLPVFNKENELIGNWKFMVPAALLSGALFSICSVVMTHAGLLSFNKTYLMGIEAGALPLEAWLFCFLMPFAGLNLYAYLNLKFPGNGPDKFTLTVSNLLLGLLVAVLFFTYKASNFYIIGIYSFLLILLAYIEYINKLRFMYRFYRAYLLLMLLCYPAYLLITGLPHIYTYFMGLFLLSVYLFELFKSKAKTV